MKAKQLRIILLLLSIGLAGCTADVTLSPTNTSTSTVTPTLFSTPTSTETPSLSPTPTYPPTLSYTQIANLTNQQLVDLNQQRYDAIRTAVKSSDSNCILPCWWGIIPGRTNWTDARQLLYRTSIDVYEYIPEPPFPPFAKGVRLFEMGATNLSEPDSVQTSIDIYTLDEIVDHIQITVDGYGNKGEAFIPNPEFLATWSFLSPEAVVAKLGVPSRVLVSQDCGGSEGWTMNDCLAGLVILYDAQGILLRYSMYTPYGKNYPICPYFSGKGNLEPNFWVKLESPNDQSTDGVSFETATGKTLVDFYQAMLQTKKPSCFYFLPGAFK